MCALWTWACDAGLGTARSCTSLPHLEQVAGGGIGAAYAAVHTRVPSGLPWHVACPWHSVGCDGHVLWACEVLCSVCCESVPAMPGSRSQPVQPCWESEAERDTCAGGSGLLDFTAKGSREDSVP